MGTVIGGKGFESIKGRDLGELYQVVFDPDPPAYPELFGQLVEYFLRLQENFGFVHFGEKGGQQLDIRWLGPEKADVTRSELQELRDEIKAKHEMLTQLEYQNSELRGYVERNLAHKRFLKTASVFLLFFSGTLAIQSLIKTPLISPSLGWTGMAVSFGVIVLSWLAGRDWNRWRSGDHYVG